MNLRQVRKKTKSIRNVKKITKAMQLVSAIKMKKAQAMETEGRPYRDTLTSVIERLLPGVDESSSSLLNESLGDTNKSLVIFVSSNKGLAGSFHVNLFRFIAKNDTDFAKTDFITVGTKGSQFVSRMGGKVLADFSKGRFLNEVSAIFSLALEKFLAGEYKRISILYNKYISAFRSEPTEETLLPMRWNDRKDAERALKLEYTIEPSPQEIIEPLIKSYLEEKVRGALVSSDAVEHASRMLAMKNATDNATDIIYNLTLIGNKLRQEKITNELLDMITAKESVGT
ncbi:ATP synthase F1 subunit gamma [Candidatus Roizmanbacteria bacterium RIFCSPHIGHO2_02_FULL_39_9]|uniref:ATP synthase gamma chain n=3 Tax=Candidatus Roizmaniibacteriota TaxID=1752723 RepID=A0A1F7HXZ8_9BACT|nr:MAG: ATP synthase F1 subunit gamma [Candidatus Roizmanbacteria bacterium RIFCSPHIGHO2_02_FULL_39_9]OGK35752.1 MAG: ATP synthase F1 subunit gamma [Candidatus Roizmanbacteria bacterium RIFCSPHIGHO2_12_FULL_39_8]